MFNSLLVANRGEIACRVFRTAKALGLRTIAVYSDVDRKALHVQLADEAVYVGPAPATESYLVIDRIIAAALQTQAQAIHPGYGFLSENADFAEACVQADIAFVGPSAESIRSMGSKIQAKRLMEAAGVPILPGYHGADQAEDMLWEHAKRIGFPLLIKASAGGGGKGMRLVSNAEEFITQLHSAKRESMHAFGDDEVLLERYLTRPKHIEVQLMADTHGNVVYLFERDCSVQRRHQKVVEEAPAPTINASLRTQLGESAVKAAQQVGYVNAGTVEFITEGDKFYFMEMNTRLQVEHPVTEAITGLDLVELQLKVAAGEVLPITQDDVQLRGHAIEVRLYAENPSNKFLPSTGRIECFDIPSSIRTDTGVAVGDEVSMHYDPMLAKLIAHGNNRDEAIRKLAQALAGARVAGVDHNLGYLLGLIQHSAFAQGDYTTQLAEQVHDSVVPQVKNIAAAIAGSYRLHRLSVEGGGDPWQGLAGFRLNQNNFRQISLAQGKVMYAVEVEEHSQREVHIRVNGESQVADIQFECDGFFTATLSAESSAEQADGYSGQVLIREGVLLVMLNGHSEKFFDITDDMARFQGQTLTQGGVISPMPGQIIAVNAAVGDKVTTGDVLVVVEAMKMEHAVVAPKSGQVSAVLFAVGDRVEEGAEMIVLE